jgi:hypothetical protein
VLPGEFETYPDWVPGMDIGQRFARISLKTVHLHGFDHTAIRLAKVRNLSRPGSQISKLQSGFELDPTRHIFRVRGNPNPTLAPALHHILWPTSETIWTE